MWIAEFHNIISDQVAGWIRLAAAEQPIGAQTFRPPAIMGLDRRQLPGRKRGKAMTCGLTIAALQKH
jgi:hypothetical protein